MEIFLFSRIVVPTLNISLAENDEEKVADEVYQGRQIKYNLPLTNVGL